MPGSHRCCSQSASPSIYAGSIIAGVATSVLPLCWWFWPLSCCGPPSMRVRAVTGILTKQVPPGRCWAGSGLCSEDVRSFDLLSLGCHCPLSEKYGPDQPCGHNWGHPTTQPPTICRHHPYCWAAEFKASPGLEWFGRGTGAGMYFSPQVNCLSGVRKTGVHRRRLSSEARRSVGRPLLR